jgi:prolyl oligopeptidase
MYRKDAAGKEEIFLDPNTFLKTEQLLGGIDFSKDGSKVYAISEGGSDWRKVIIMDAISKKSGRRHID